MADIVGAGVVPPPIPAAAGFGGLGGLGAAGYGGVGGLFPGLTASFDGGILPGFAAGSYVPVTPLGALSALKGDLLIPIVAVGVAIFLLLIIVLAVKAALTWKIDLLEGLKASKFAREAAVNPPAQTQERVNELASIVMDALDSEKCLDKIICSIGSYGQGSSWASYFSTVESLISEDYRPKLSVLKSCAEGTHKVEDFQCGKDSQLPAGSAGQQVNQQGGQQQQQANAANAKPKMPLLSTLGSNASLKPQAQAGNAAAAKPSDAENRI